MKSAGFKILGHDSSPIAPVYIGDAKLAGVIANEMFKEGIYVIGFSYPVVPKVIYIINFINIYNISLFIYNLRDKV